MSLLLETLEAIEDNNLGKTQLEDYHKTLSSLYGDLKIEIAGLKKLESIHYLKTKTPEKSAITVKHEWRVSPEGDRLLLLLGYLGAVSKALDSLKGRIYSKIM